MRFTVVWSETALAELATLWLNADDREAVRAASDRIDVELRANSMGVGRPYSRGRRTLIIRPLAVTYKVNEGDRTVIVSSVSRVDHRSNGHPN